MFEFEQKTRQNYEYGHGRHNSITWRALTRSTLYGMEGYSDIMPEIDGLSLLDWLNRAYSQSPNLAIMDVGYGMGLYLLELTEKFGDKFSYYAYGDPTASKRHEQTIIDNHSLITIDPTFDRMVSNNIKIIPGNIIDIDQISPNRQIDLLTLSIVLRYVPYPRIALMEKIFSVMSQTGHVLIADDVRMFYDPEVTGTLNDLKSWCRDQGISLECDHKMITRNAANNNKYYIFNYHLYRL